MGQKFPNMQSALPAQQLYNNRHIQLNKQYKHNEFRVNINIRVMNRNMLPITEKISTSTVVT